MQVGKAGSLPASTGAKDRFFMLGLLLNLWIVHGFIAAFLASLCWMAVMTKFNLSHAYPFMGLSFVRVLTAAAFSSGRRLRQ